MIVSWIRKHELLSFFVLAFAFSWAIEIPLILSRLNLGPAIPHWAHYLTAYGPMLAAFIIQGIAGGRAAERRLLKSMVNWNVGTRWIIIGGFSPVILYLVIAFAIYLVNGQPLQVGLLGKINFLPDLGFWAWLFWIFNSGIGEETGWRGFALPRLNRERSALSAAITLGVIWSCWHLPAFFYLPNYMKLGIGIFPIFALGVISGSILFSWLFNSTGGSLLMAILWHGAFNFVTASGAGEGLAAIILNNLIIIWAVLIVLICKPKNLSFSPKYEG